MFKENTQQHGRVLQGVKEVEELQELVDAARKARVTKKENKTKHLAIVKEAESADVRLMEIKVSFPSCSEVDSGISAHQQTLSARTCNT